MVLNLRGDEVGEFAGLQVGLKDAEEGEVVALGAAGGEDDLGGAGVKKGGYVFAGLLDGGAGVLALLVDGAGVAESARSRRDAWHRRPEGGEAWWRSRPCRFGARVKFTPVGVGIW